MLLELSTFKKRNKIPNNPIVNGFILESVFLQGLQNLRFFETLSGGEKYTFDIHYLCALGTNEKLTCMEAGVLYHLHHKHPVIDAVGVLKRRDRRKHHLVFIQISLSKYSSHSSKIEDLYVKIDCNELNSKFSSIFQYYMEITENLIKSKKAFYVYVSPAEVPPKVSKLLTRYKYPDLRVGVIPKLSETNNLVSRVV